MLAVICTTRLTQEVCRKRREKGRAGGRDGSLGTRVVEEKERGG